MCNKMSDVRLSNASPTVERVDARQPDTVRTPVRRNLFGSPDREEVRRYLSAAIQESVQDFREEYNFDPVSERPLTPRSYDWQEDSDAPEFYRRAPHGSHRPPPEADSPGTSCREAEPSAGGGRKRRSGDPGPCSGQSSSKKSHTDEDDSDGRSGGAAGQALAAAEERPGSAEVQ